MLCPEVSLLSSDFNFQLDDSSDADARKFMELTDTFGLLQHITTPSMFLDTYSILSSYGR